MSSDLLKKQGLSLERLESFCKIVVSGGLTLAAGSNTGRVALLSRQLSDLEEYFGVKLIVRTGRGMKPTDAGEELFQIVRHDLHLLEGFRAKCEGQPATVRITAGNSMIHWALAPHLAELSARLPGLAFELHALRTFERVPAVRHHECDLAIVRRETITGQLKGKALMPMHHRLFVHRKLVERAGTKDANKLLQKLPLALPPEGDLRVILDQAVSLHHMKLNIVLSVPTFTMAARAVLTGSFASILPHVAERDFDEKDFAILPVPLLGNYVQRLSICWNPSFARISQVVAKTRPALLELLGQAGKG